ncbi:GNAT family N-acetyltransferase [uncultured Pseudokineococcus sp.]|uniref:GNAT family N-acetyltransferase n=1 Tax=uncultured Pseudokineococcus sp. TaxID=1642928 RepID=UPI002625C5FE|nr:GNAT family N-acetyltransferase [uncultured Pseudokineococcus sp.]
MPHPLTPGGEAAQPVALPPDASVAGPEAGDPFLRWHLAPSRVHGAWRRGAATGVLADRRRGRSLVVLGPADDAAALVTAVLDDAAPALVTLPRGTPDLLRAREPAVGARLVGGDDWDWAWTTSAPAGPLPGEEDVAVLEVGARERPGPDAAAVADLLAAASPRSSVQPGDAHARAWFGLRRGDRVVACVAATGDDGGPAPHLASVATHPDLRGRGLGAAVTAGATRRLLREAPAVTLGMYADNDVARRMYTRLGWAWAHRFSSRVVRPAASRAPAA